MDMHEAIDKQFEVYPSTLRAKQVIEMLGISQRTFYDLMRTGGLPDCMLIGRQKRWFKATVVDFMLKSMAPPIPSEQARARGAKGARARCTREIKRKKGTKSKSQQRKEREEGLQIASQQSRAVVA